MSTSTKHFLRSLAPAFLREIATHLRHEQAKVFESFGDAAKAAGSYDDDLINRFRFARSELNRRRGYLPSLDGCALLWLAELLPPGKLVITDFGGATGEYGEALQARRGGICYTVVENPTLARMMKTVDLPIGFVTEIPISCDVFFSSGVLQYLTDPYQVLSSGFTSARRAVVLARNSFCEKEIFRVQQARLFDNGWGDVPPGFENTVIGLPHRTISESRVRAIANEQGFRLIARTLDDSGGFSHEEAYGAQLVFLRGRFNSL